MASKKTVYSFPVKKLTGEEVSLDIYKGKVLLIVNTASACGEVGQLGELEELYKEFKDQGLVVIGFPSNDFSDQEPLEGKAIEQFCQINYGVSFPIFDKIKVRGDDAHPLFLFFADKNKNGVIAAKPWWNYYKYLINKKGEVVDYFITYRHANASKIKKSVTKLLEEK